MPEEGPTHTVWLPEAQAFLQCEEGGVQYVRPPPPRDRPPSQTHLWGQCGPVSLEAHRGASQLPAH